MTINHEAARDIGAATLKTALPVTAWAMTLNHWVALATLGYILLQAAYLIWKWRREAVAKNTPLDA
jgi:hypothetical protein